MVRLWYSFTLVRYWSKLYKMLKPSPSKKGWKNFQLHRFLNTFSQLPAVKKYSKNGAAGKKIWPFLFWPSFSVCWLPDDCSYEQQMTVWQIAWWQPEDLRGCLKQWQNKKGQTFVWNALKMVSFFRAARWEKDTIFWYILNKFLALLFLTGLW